MTNRYTGRGGGRVTDPYKLCCLVSLAELPEAVVLFLLEVGLLLHLCLVEPVDDGVLALDHEDALNLCERPGVRVSSSH
jgi:hypothetical protein